MSPLHVVLQWYKLGNMQQRLLNEQDHLEVNENTVFSPPSLPLVDDDDKHGLEKTIPIPTMLEGTKHICLIATKIAAGIKTLTHPFRLRLSILRGGDSHVTHTNIWGLVETCTGTIWFDYKKSKHGADRETECKAVPLPMTVSERLGVQLEILRLNPLFSFAMLTE